MLLLSGDIGGTKTILRMVDTAPDYKSWQTIAEAKYVSANFVDLVPMVRQFIAENQLEIPKLASFAIAGPVVNNSCNLTNLSWQLTTSRLEKELEIAKVTLINDFAANSYGVLGLQESEIAALQTGQKIADAPIAVIGAGTGLGESFLLPYNNKYSVFASEGGHTDFAPQNELEVELLKYLQNRFEGHVSVERVVSGQGIVNIYQFLRDSKFAPENEEIASKITAWENHAATKIDPGEIVAQGAENQDNLCQQAMKMFVEAYGAATGNLALKILPYGGIYLAGGIAAKNLSLMKQGDFIRAYKDKGRMQTLLENIPIYVILNPQVGLIGSIAYALDR